MKPRYAFYIFIVSLFLSLYAADYFLHRTDPRRKLPVNGFFQNISVTWGHIIQNNRFGFRERDFIVPKPNATYRIMVMGDSLTWGVGLSTESRYTGVLETMFHEAYPGIKVEVLNFGIPGFDMEDYRDTLKNFKEQVAPDRIVVGFCINDTQPKGQDYTAEKERFVKKFGRYFDYVYFAFEAMNLSLLGTRIEQAIYKFLTKINVLPDWTIGMDRTYDINSQEWKGFVEAMKEIKNISDSGNLMRPVFAVLISPVYSDRPTNYAQPDERTRKFKNWFNQAAQTANATGFETIEYENEYISTFSKSIPIVNVADGHPGAELNRLYANKLFTTLSKAPRFKTNSRNR